MSLTFKAVLTALLAGPATTHELATRTGTEANKLAPLMGKLRKRGDVDGVGVPTVWSARQLDAFPECRS